MKISVLLPTRNRLELLRYAVESALEQSDDAIEVVISDNCSEDDIGGFVRSLADPRVVYVRTEEPLPVTDNWNNALAHSTGDYVIMLGDDDALLRGYFTEVRRLIERFDGPDFVYTGAYHFAYPGVLREHPEGRLIEPHRFRAFGDARGPFLLGRRAARRIVRDSMQLRLPLNYNMQHMTVRRSLIEALAGKGPFFQSPYPDYYAANAMFLEASRIVMDPRPLVAIGISPKSFGAFLFNDRESEGVEFLMNAPDEETRDRLQRVLLPGPTHNTSWLIAMDRLRRNFGREHGLRVGVRRYRLLQAIHVYKGVFAGREGARERLAALKRKLTCWERIGFGLAYAVTATALRLLSGDRSKRLRLRLFRWVGQYPTIERETHQERYRTMRDVFRTGPAAGTQ